MLVVRIALQLSQSELPFKIKELIDLIGDLGVLHDAMSCCDLERATLLILQDEHLDFDHALLRAGGAFPVHVSAHWTQQQPLVDVV